MKERLIQLHLQTHSWIQHLYPQSPHSLLLIMCFPDLFTEHNHCLSLMSNLNAVPLMFMMSQSHDCDIIMFDCVLLKPHPCSTLSREETWYPQHM